jgi:hypothetical protein
MGGRPPAVALSEVRGWTLEFLGATPDFASTVNAALDYPMAEKLGGIRQPLLVLALHDNAWPSMQRALPLLPPQAEVVELPQVELVMSTFTVHTQEIVRHLRRFLS